MSSAASNTVDGDIKSTSSPSLGGSAMVWKEKKSTVESSSAKVKTVYVYTRELQSFYAKYPNGTSNVHAHEWPIERDVVLQCDASNENDKWWVLRSELERANRLTDERVCCCTDLLENERPTDIPFNDITVLKTVESIATNTSPITSTVQPLDAKIDSLTTCGDQVLVSTLLQNVVQKESTDTKLLPIATSCDKPDQKQVAIAQSIGADLPKSASQKTNIIRQITRVERISGEKLVFSGDHNRECEGYSGLRIHTTAGAIDVLINAHEYCCESFGIFINGYQPGVGSDEKHIFNQMTAHSGMTITDVSIGSVEKTSVGEHSLLKEKLFRQEMTVMLTTDRGQIKIIVYHEPSGDCGETEHQVIVRQPGKNDELFDL